MANTSIFYLTSNWQMGMGSHQLLRPRSLGVHSVSNSDSPWLPEDQHTWFACCPHFHLTQHSLPVTCAFTICMICKMSLPTFLDTLGFQEEKRLFTAGALMGSLALQTVAVTAWKTEVKSIRTCMALQGAPGPHREAALDTMSKSTWCAGQSSGLGVSS